jgi:YgiT-type zinc finger domain-containing protein
MASLSEIEHGKCPCGGQFENREVEVTISVSSPAIVLSGVSQGVCPICGSRVYKARVLECIESVMREGSVPQSH